MMTSVKAIGLVHGCEIADAARLAIEDTGVVLTWSNGEHWLLPFDAIDGINVEPTGLTLYLPDHDVLELSGDDSLRALGLRLVDKACRMPELTRGLRGLGAARTPGAGRMSRQGDGAALRDAHDRWFAPLLAARRAVHDVSDATRQVALMNAVDLADAMRRTINAMATAQAPGDAAEQRALEAAIEDEALPLFEALDRMAVAGEAVRGGATDTRFADWRRWVETANRVYAEADEAWTGIAEVLTG